VICARRHNARREEDGPATLAGAANWVRDGGDRLVADAGERRCGGGPRRASPTQKQRAWAATPSDETPRDLSRRRREPRLSAATLRRLAPMPKSWPGGRTVRHAGGVPLKTLEIVLTSFVGACSPVPVRRCRVVLSLVPWRPS
jgi:hypothetical protein